MAFGEGIRCEPTEALPRGIDRKLDFQDYARPSDFLAVSMEPASFPARPARSNYRHELRTLTYVTLDEGNGGIIRNLSHDGVAVQAVARLREEQKVRLRFELRFPRLRIEACGQVSWSNPSGQCGIRFVDLPERTSHQINEWIFSNLLDSMVREAAQARPIFGSCIAPIAPEEQDGLIVSAQPRPAIKLEPDIARLDEGLALRHRGEDFSATANYHDTELNWLSRPLSARSLAWMVDSLVIIAGLLLFALIFLSIAHELPQWQLTLGAGFAAAVFVAATYRTLFAVFGGPSLGARLAQAATSLEQEDEERGGERRFR